MININNGPITVLHKVKKVDNGLINVLHKTRNDTVIETKQIKEGTVTFLHDVINLPYSLRPSEFRKKVTIVAYPGVLPNRYTAKTSGVIIDKRTGVEVNSFNNCGYRSVILDTNTGGKLQIAVHRIIAYAFCNPPVDYDHKVVNHIDGIKDNNRSNNLEWITITANNQHARAIHQIADSHTVNGHPIMTDKLVHHLCQEFAKGKSNVQIMHENNMIIDNQNHETLRDIRGGYTWKHITRLYTFDRSSKKHAYTTEEKNKITEYIRQGKIDIEIFALMNGREYVASTDRLGSKYKTIFSLRAKERLRLKRLGEQK